MINSITPIKINTPAFTGRTPKFQKMDYDVFQFQNPQKFIKKLYNYCPAGNGNAEKIDPYKGPQKMNAGFSTEAGGYGGGWLVADARIPLSTTDVHTCAVMNLVDEYRGKHALLHVYHKTTAEKIEGFINKYFPNFTKVNIVGGDQFPTVNTMKKILQAVDNVNPNVNKNFYYTVNENPELVAYCGDMYYMKNKSGTVSFIQNTKNYWD